MSSFWARQGGGTSLAVGVALVGVTAAVLGSRATRRGSSSESAALATASQQKSGGAAIGALDTLRACASSSARNCACADAAEELAVDLGRYDDAWAAVEHASCDSARHAGARAEALVAVGRGQEGMQEAAAALARDPAEPHAAYARAWVLSVAMNSPAAVDAAEHAVLAGRGVPALLLLGMLRFRAGDVGSARPLFDQAVSLAPNDAHALYDQALVAQTQGRYRDAREGYLRALAIDPKMVDARYNLVVLTHGAGADDEARHDMDVLVAIAPNDPRIPGLRALLAKP